MVQRRHFDHLMASFSSDALVKPCISQAKCSSIYRVKAILGSGSFGTVYDAVRKKDGKPVAIKKFRKGATYKEQNGVTVSKEIAAARRLVGIPGVVQYYDHYSTDYYELLVMERLQNFIQLQDFINYYGLLSENLVKLIFRQLVEAFMESARRNVYHQDLKTENILLGLETGVVKVIDYGIAAITDDVEMDTSAFGSHIHGCNPPEWGIVKRVKPSKIMVWTLGRQLYTLLTNDQTLENDCMTYMKPRWPGHVSTGARRLTMKCLTENPGGRPTFSGILHDLWLQKAPSVPCNLSSLIDGEKLLSILQKLETDVNPLEYPGFDEDVEYGDGNYGYSD